MICKIISIKFLRLASKPIAMAQQNIKSARLQWDTVYNKWHCVRFCCYDVVYKKLQPLLEEICDYCIYCARYKTV
jgi:hypothetical protein